MQLHVQQEILFVLYRMRSQHLGFYFFVIGSKEIVNRLFYNLGHESSTNEQQWQIDQHLSFWKWPSMIFHAHLLFLAKDEDTVAKGLVEEKPSAVKLRKRWTLSRWMALVCPYAICDRSLEVTMNSEHWRKKLKKLVSLVVSVEFRSNNLNGSCRDFPYIPTYMLGII